MKKFLIKNIYFASILLVPLTSLLTIPSYYLFTTDYERGYYYSNLLYIQNNNNYDITFLGSSHAKMFEICDSWQLTENILNAKYINIADLGGGVLNQQIFLNYFYSLGNKSHTVIYFIDPFMITSDYYDYVGALNKEPFKLDFLLTMIKSDVDNRIVLPYLKTKMQLTHQWLQIFKCERRNEGLTMIDSLGIARRAYELSRTDVIDNNMLIKQTTVINTTINLIEKNNSNLIFIIPPTLIENELGYDELIAFLEKIKKEKGINYYDYHTSIRDIRYFLDYDHLNQIGQKYFLKNHLTNVVNEN